MRASSRLVRDAGITTSPWAAMIPLRMRVRKSAMGSVIDMCDLPARLRHAGDVAGVRQLAQADPAQAEPAVHRARAAAAPTAGIGPRRELRRPLLADDLRLLRHQVLRVLTPPRPRSPRGPRSPPDAPRGRTACRAPAAARSPRRPSPPWS